jgi:outer membrane protein OmpA-like peptidoglycan-associated protein
MADGGRRIAVIYFRHGSASLQGRDRKVLRDVAQIYERQGRDLRVVGHASSRTAAMDPVDHRMANFDTSLKRAQAVVDALVSMGVPRDAIQLEARGDNEPVYHEFMPTGEAGNRRAEIFLQG